MVTVGHSENIVKLDILRIYIFLLMVSIVSGASAVFSRAASAAVMLAGVCVSGVYGAVLKPRTDSYKIELIGNNITISSGVFKIGKKQLSLSRVQYAQLIQTPLQRCFSAYTLILRTQTSSLSVTDISGDGVDRLMSCLKENGL